MTTETMHENAEVIDIAPEKEKKEGAFEKFGKFITEHPIAFQLGLAVASAAVGAVTTRVVNNAMNNIESSIASHQSAKMLADSSSLNTDSVVEVEPVVES